MRRITVELMRKRSEHNEGEIRTMKELSLHQEKLAKIENIDRWCRELEILLLHSNNISKIENVSRLKHLKYLNLCLNNIEIIEGLEGCESLQKLDLTLNFIGKITSVKALVHNIHLQNLYLSGNPLCDFPGHKEYVIASLPQILLLDGEDITKTKKILAKQNLAQLEQDALKYEKQYLEKREAQRQTFVDQDLEDEEFWSQTSANTPEVRSMMQRRLEADEDEKNGDKKQDHNDNPQKARRSYFKEDGRAFNINDGKYPLKISDEPDKGNVLVEIGVPKFMDTSLLSVDIQPTYVRVIVKKNIVQICLPDEVHPDSSTVQRSTTTGSLMLRMPMLDQSGVVKFQQKAKKLARQNELVKESGLIGAGESVTSPNSSVEPREKGTVSRDTTTLLFNDKTSCVDDHDEVPPLE